MKDKYPQSVCFDTAITKFLSHIESLWTSLPIVLKTINATNDNAVKTHTSFLRDECEYVESEDHYLIKPEQHRKNVTLRKAATNSLIAQKIIKRNYLVSLVSQFDTYISEMIKCIFLTKPEMLNASEKQISFSDLLKFGDVETVKESIIEKEIESVLRESHTEQFKWFEKKLALPLRKDLSIWATFIELTQRRNIFVHNDGKVSNQYLQVCKEHNVTLKPEVVLGLELELDMRYFESAFRTLFEIGVKLNQVIRRSLLPQDIESADHSFLIISFELVENRQYQLAKELYDFSDKYIKKFSNEDLRLRILLNRAQAYKWLGQDEECRKIIESVDWTATGELYKLGSAVLLEDYDRAIETMKSIGNNEKIIEKVFYKDWPIFKKFRQIEKFKNAYLEIFSETFEITEDRR